jgi:hypothetical protein
MDSEESYSTGSSAATRHPSCPQEYLSNLADLLTHFNETCEYFKDAYSHHDHSGDPRLCNILSRIGDMLAEVDPSPLFSSHPKALSLFLSNFLTLNARQLSTLRPSLGRPVALLLLAFSGQLEFVDRLAARSAVKRKVLECGAVLQGKPLADLKLAAENLLRIH